MPHIKRNLERANELLAELKRFIAAEVERFGGKTNAVNPGHRIRFAWPPHPISYDYHVLASDWRGSIEVDLHGEEFSVLLATTPHGVFGRISTLWAEARGKTEDEMVNNLRKICEPLFARQRLIGRTLGFEGRYSSHLNELDSLAHLKLLYCEDRDVANDARTCLETGPNKLDLLPCLLEILSDHTHPFRRSAQWCVLDLLEDVSAYCETDEDEIRAIDVIQHLIMHAEDDFARTAFKAGVVLGGHLPDQHGGPALIQCLTAPSKYGRRSAIHGLFHVVEWHPESKEMVVRALQRVVNHDPEPQLREFADLMAQDISAEQVDHIQEPIFDDESS